MIFSKTYKLSDIHFYDPMTSESGHWTIPSEVRSSSIFGYSSNGWTFGNASAYLLMPCDIQVTIPYKVSFKIIDINNNGSALTYALNSNRSEYLSSRTSTGQLNMTNTNVNAYVTRGHEYHIIVYSNKWELYDGDTLLGTRNVSISNSIVQFETGSNRSITIKDFKIREL